MTAHDRGVVSCVIVSVGILCSVCEVADIRVVQEEVGPPLPTRSTTTRELQCL